VQMIFNSRCCLQQRTNTTIAVPFSCRGLSRSYGDGARARDGVATEVRVPDVDLNTRVVGLVGTGELDTGGACGATTSNGDLVATHVELCATRPARRVKCDGLGPQQIVTRRDAGWYLHGLLAAALVDDVVAPGLGGGVVSRLKDLEPGRRAVGSLGVADLGHVDKHGSKVVASNAFVCAVPVTRLLVHLDSHARASWYRADALRSLRAGIAYNRVARNRSDRAVGGRLPNTRPCLVYAIYPELLEGRVS
jgi:hypothetical protein